MTILLYLGVAFGAGMLGLLTRRRPSISISIGLAGLAAAVVTSILVSPGERIQVGDTALVASDFQRLFLVFGSIAALAITVMALAHEWQRNLPSAMLIGLGALGLGLGLRGARGAFRWLRGWRRSVGVCGANGGRGEDEGCEQHLHGEHRLKSETRDPKSERRPKSETRKRPLLQNARAAGFPKPR